jgi:hypothetical protein
MVELDRDGVVGRKIILKLRRRTPSLLQGRAWLSALLDLTVESGLVSVQTWQNPVTSCLDKNNSQSFQLFRYVGLGLTHCWL